MFTKTRIIAGGVACFLLLGAASCSTNQPTTGNGKPVLQSVGDSITVQATPDINTHFSGGYDVGIQATVGYDTYLQAGTIYAEAHATSPPAVEIIDLGTNDAASVGVARFNGAEPAQSLTDIESRFTTFSTEFPASTCVIFVNANTHVDPVKWGAANAQAIDDYFAANPAVFTHVVDWNSAWSPSYFDTAGDVHPNETGKQALLGLEDAAIAGCTPAS